MYSKRFSAYLGEEQEKVFSRFFTADSLFLLVKIKEAEDKDRLRDSFDFFFNQLLSTSIDGLNGLDEFITKKIKELNLPLGLSLVCGFRKDKTFYLKTINGQVFIYRKSQLAKLIDGDQSASGYIKDNDLFIFTTASFINLVKKSGGLEKYLKEGEPNKIVDHLAPELKPFDNQGSIALFIQFLAFQEDNFSGKNREKLFVSKLNFFSRVKTYFTNYWQKKKPSPRFLGVFKNKKLVLLLFLLLIAFVWSVVLGYGRRQRVRNLKRIAQVDQDINKKLAEAENERSVSIQESKKSIAEAKKELENLRKEMGTDFEKELLPIASSIRLEENKLIKKESKKTEEFFDLALEDKNVQGKQFSLSKNKLAILATNGKSYLLDLDKKAISKYVNNELRSVDFIALYGKKIFFFSKKDGIFSLKNNQFDKIINPDKDWENIGDFSVYNNNLYLLDRHRGNIYRYLVIENGYSGGQPYFKVNGQSALNLSEANSMAIDGSIYICFENRVIKYLSGRRQKFSLSLPDENFSLTKIYTNRNLDSVYLFDKTHGVIYQLTKDGDYKKEIRSDSLKKAVDIIFYRQSAYLLVGSKILKINL